MGVRSRARGPSDVAPLRIVHQGEAARLFARGELTLEDGTRLSVDDHLPPDLPLGYHTFRGNSQPMRIICAPRTCVEPPKAIWGWAAQLYSTRSQASWGIGDLADLRRLGEWSAASGAGCVLINPLTAGPPLATQQASPYSPTSRRFRNPLYLRIEEIPGSAEALGDELNELANAGKALNRKRLIDRASVFAIKQRACEKIWARFRGDPGFDRYRAEQGAALVQFATYCALAETFGGDWRTWPAEFRHPNNAATQTFAAEHEHRVAFHAWLQWLVDEQLAHASKQVAIMHDLPIGFEAGGADAWTWQDLLADGATVGAPPDAYNIEGQDWGLPPLVPHKLRAAGYQPFVETIRAALRHAGALRIDHVMGLFRLFWIPKGFGAKQGTYVRYRADEMLAILALESQRAGAFIVGEDLGTVEPGVRETMAEHRVLSYRVLWFEDAPIAKYPTLAMVSPATHDLPTVAGLWTGHDLEDQQRIGLTGNEESSQQMLQRLRTASGADAHDAVETVIERIYTALARAPSRIVTASLEDALAVEQRVNMPGTVDQWPNWSLPLPGGLEALEASPLARSIAKALSTRSTVQPHTA
jgi:4-alpha-glucanotransferase